MTAPPHSTDTREAKIFTFSFSIRARKYRTSQPSTIPRHTAPAVGPRGILELRMNYLKAGLRVLVVCFCCHSLSAQEGMWSLDKWLHEYGSLNFLPNLFSSTESFSNFIARTPAADLQRLYEDLYSLGEKQKSFIDSMMTYDNTVERQASGLERDFKLNDVGIAARNLNQGLALVSEDFSELGAQMSIDNPDVEAIIKRYLPSRDLILGKILDEHILSGATPAQLRSTIEKAQQNSRLFDCALARLRIEIYARQHPNEISKPDQLTRAIAGACSAKPTPSGR